MKRLLTALSMAIIAASFASTASADTWTPNDPVDPTAIALESIGIIAVGQSQGISLGCNLAGTATIASTGDTAEINSLDLHGSFLCALVDFTDVPYPLSCDAQGNVTITDVVIQGFIGDCAGNLTGTIDNTTGVISFRNAILPCATDCPGDCEITGDIKTNPAVTCTNP